MKIKNLTLIIISLIFAGCGNGGDKVVDTQKNILTQNSWYNSNSCDNSSKIYTFDNVNININSYQDEEFNISDTNYSYNIINYTDGGVDIKIGEKEYSCLTSYESPNTTNIHMQCVNINDDSDMEYIFTIWNSKNLAIQNKESDCQIINTL